MRRLKLHGAFRSGTNYVRALLELNYDVRLVANNGGWKHAPVPANFDRDPGWPIVAVVKDPFSWLLSLFSHVTGDASRHFECGDTWQDFLREPITMTHADKEEVPVYWYGSPVDYWNAMSVNFLSLGDRAAVVRYEHVLADPEASCQQMANRFELSRREGRFVTIEQRTRTLVDRPRDSVDAYVTDEVFDRAWYTDRRYMAEWSAADRRWVTRRLDQRAMSHLGYPVH